MLLFNIRSVAGWARPDPQVFQFHLYPHWIIFQSVGIVIWMLKESPQIQPFPEVTLLAFARTREGFTVNVQLCFTSLDHTHVCIFNFQQLMLLWLPSGNTETLIRKQTLHIPGQYPEVFTFRYQGVIKTKYRWSSQTHCPGCFLQRCLILVRY